MMEHVAVGKARHWLAIFTTLLVGEAVADAQEFAAPADRNYTIDLFIGQAIGSSRIVGMGGAATAMAQGSPGMLANPASPAVRSMTSGDDWDWDWHLDSMSPSLGSDHDNNGITTNDSSFSPSATFGAVVQYKAWGVGFSATGLVIENSTADSSGVETRIRSEALVNQLVVARHFLHGDLVIGAAARGVLLQVTNVDNPSAEQTLLELAGGSLETGVIWKPSARRFRVGAAMRLPVVSDETSIEACDPQNCAGYVLPNKVKVPWEASVGIAGRKGPSAWNRTAKTRWVDEKAILWDVDLVVTGTTKRGAGLEAFGQHKLQPSGRKHSVSIRGGVDYEWIPGRFRVRGGSYYEPSRFRDPSGADTGGRLHLTLGTDLRVWQFGFWDEDYRVRISLTGDFARSFGNGGLSIGFWH